MASTPGKEGVGQALLAGIAGLIYASLVGWVATMMSDTLEAAANIQAIAAWGLAVVIPGSVVFLTRSNLRRGVRTPYRGLISAGTALATATVLGTFAGFGLYLIPTTNLPSIFLALDEVALREAMVGAMGWAPLLGCLVMGLVVTGWLAPWASGHASDDDA